jgi:hypothetical protein
MQVANITLQQRFNRSLANLYLENLRSVININLTVPDTFENDPMEKKCIGLL